MDCLEVTQALNNQIYVTADNKYTTDRWLVANTHGTWSFTRIYYINFMLSNALCTLR